LKANLEQANKEQTFGEVKDTMSQSNVLAALKLEILDEQVCLHKKCLMRPSHYAHKLWDYYIMVIAIYNGIQLPVEISFDPPWMRSTSNVVVNSFIDLSFLLDIFVMFRTTIQGDGGEEVTDNKQIAIKYLKGSFTIDILSTVPLDYLASLFLPPAAASRFRLFGSLKLIRVSRLNRIIRGLSLERSLKTTLKLLKLMFLLVLYVHCVGCLWYYITVVDASWVPQQDN
jgi:potassium channel